MHPILDIYKDSPIKFTLHCVGLPHTNISDTHISCAYSLKIKKFIKMMSAHGHNVIAYGNEGSVVPINVEFIQILSEKERNSFGFAPGPFDTAAQFPGCDKYGSTNVIFCDIGSGHQGFDTEYVCYESASWRNYIYGKYNVGWERYTDAVVPNYFDLEDFRFGADPVGTNFFNWWNQLWIFRIERIFFSQCIMGDK